MHAFTLAQQYLREYPHNEFLLHNITVCIDGLLNMTILSQEDCSSWEKWVLNAYESLSDSTDDRISNSANFMLANKMIRKGEYDHAQAIIDKMPDKQETSQALADKIMLQVQIYQHQKNLTEAIKTIQHALFSSVTRVQLLLGQLSSLEQSGGNPEIARQIIRKSTEYAILFDLWKYYSYSNQFQIAVRERDPAQAIQLARCLFQSIQHPWNTKNTSLFYHIDWNYSQDQIRNLQTVLWSSLVQEPEFKFLRDEPAFMELLEEYRA